MRCNAGTRSTNGELLFPVRNEPDWGRDEQPVVKVADGTVERPKVDDGQTDEVVHLGTIFGGGQESEDVAKNSDERTGYDEYEGDTEDRSSAESPTAKDDHDIDEAFS
jgi:hypothetical protein